MIHMQEIMEEMWILTILFFIKISFFSVQGRHYKRGPFFSKKGDSQSRDTIIRERE